MHISQWIQRRILSLLAVITILSRAMIIDAEVLVESGDNKLVPYSTSNLSFKINMAHVKEIDDHIVRIKKLICTLQVTPEPNADHHWIKFQTDGINLTVIGGVLSKVGEDTTTNKGVYAYDATMSKDCTITTTDNEIKFIFNGENALNDPLADFMLTAYIPTGGVYKAGIEQSMEIYQSNFIESNSKLSFMVKDITIETIYEEPMVSSLMGVELPSTEIEKTIYLGQGLIEATYFEIPLIN